MSYDVDIKPFARVLVETMERAADRLGDANTGEVMGGHDMREMSESERMGVAYSVVREVTSAMAGMADVLYEALDDDAQSHRKVSIAVARLVDAVNANAE